jgi:hypothetical protein
VNTYQKEIINYSYIAGVVFLSGCKGKLKEGEIYNKEFIPAHTRNSSDLYSPN